MIVHAIPTKELEVQTTDFQLNQATFKRVAKELHLKHPVKISFSDLLDGTYGDPNPDVYGNYDFAEGVHRIHLKRGQSRLETVESLLHELRHAHQHDKIGSAWGYKFQYAQSLATDGYYNNPMERDARDFSENAVGRFSDLLEGDGPPARRVYGSGGGSSGEWEVLPGSETLFDILREAFGAY